MDLSKELEYWRAERPDEWKMEEFIKNAKAIEQENAKLKTQLENSSICEICENKAIAQLLNTRLGLEKTEKLIRSGIFSLIYNPKSHHEEESFSLINALKIEASAPTLADLIDKVALKEDKPNDQL